MALLERLGVETVPLFVEMDGLFPNHHPDPTVEKNLQDLIRCVREEALILASRMMETLTESAWSMSRATSLGRPPHDPLEPRHLGREPGAAIVSEVKCSRTLFDDIAAHGGRPIMSQVGHSIIKERMMHEGALWAGR